MAPKSRIPSMTSTHFAQPPSSPSSSPLSSCQLYATASLLSIAPTINIAIATPLSNLLSPMSTNILEIPITKIQKKLSTHLPWSLIASNLVSLLSRYSTGLSFPVVCDEILALRKSAEKQPQLPISHRASIVRISTESPEVWLLRLQDGRHVAFYAHSKFTARFVPGVSFSFYALVPDTPSRRPNEVEALSVAKSLLSDSSSTASTPVESAKGSTQSPVDITKLHHAEAAHTPSQHASNQLPQMACAILPTPNVLLNFDSVPPASLNLNEPIERFTLQRVWDERTCSPAFIYALVVDIGSKPTIIRLQDQQSQQSISQPSVQWILHDHQSSYIHMVHVGCFVVLEKPAVVPDGNSFSVVANEHTICFYRNPPSKPKLYLEPHLPTTILVPESPPRKRRRTDLDLSLSEARVDANSLANLHEPQNQKDLVVITRAVSRPSIEDPFLTEICCVSDVRIRILGEKTVQRCASIYPGDQLVFQGVNWIAGSHTIGSQTSAGWFAKSFQNLSTLCSILYSPLARYMMSAEDVKNSMRSSETPEARLDSQNIITAHVGVRITSALLNHEAKRLILTVYNCGSSLHSNPKSTYTRFRKAPAHLKPSPQSHLKIVVRDPCYEQLFQVKDGNSFWGASCVSILESNLARLKEITWIMAISFRQGSVSENPSLRSCVRGAL